MVFRRFGTWVPPTFPWRWRQNVPLRPVYVCQTYHVTSQRTINFVFRDCSIVCICQTVAITSVCKLCKFPNFSHCTEAIEVPWMVLKSWPSLLLVVFLSSTLWPVLTNKKQWLLMMSVWLERNGGGVAGVCSIELLHRNSKHNKTTMEASQLDYILCILFNTVNIS
jgi:hypothetical protein